MFVHEYILSMIIVIDLKIIVAYKPIFISIIVHTTTIVKLLLYVHRMGLAGGSFQSLQPHAMDQQKIKSHCETQQCSLMWKYSM